MDTLDKVTGVPITAQPARLRGSDSRAAEVATDIARIAESVASARDLLDFNDEPARFDAWLHKSSTPRGRRR